MSKFNEIGNKANEKVTGLLSGKPIWFFWIAFTILIAVVFGITYAVIYFLSFKWWFLLLVIVIAGMASGTFAYLKDIQVKTADK